MSGSSAPQSEDPPAKLKRSRNGCTECRRLHRRCGEEKPTCANCRESGKVCSYQKPLSWGGRPFKKSTFGNALGSGVVEIPIEDSDDDSRKLETSLSATFADSVQQNSAYRRSFVYGQAGSSGNTTDSVSEIKVETRSKSVPAGSTVGQDDSISEPQAGDLFLPLAWLPWLSQHHRGLFHHFVESTVTIFTSNHAQQQEIRSTIIPMAVFTNHGFSLLAAIISLASTHRMNLGQHRDAAEIEYWKDMSVGHLRRPTVHEDESTENVFASTALVLAIRDIISEAEQHSSWKVHLQGALTILTRGGDGPATEVTATKRVLEKVARSLVTRSPLPTATSPSENVDSSLKQADPRTEALGLPYRLSAIFQHIRALRFEKNALLNIESSSGSTHMQPLWDAVRGQCLEIIVQLNEFSESVGSDGSEDASHELLHGRVALLQVYSGILDLSTSDSGLRNTVETTMSTLRSLDVDDDGAPIDPDLVLALFTVGCLVRSIDDRRLIHSSLTRIVRQHGKGNANLAKAFLEELWATIDSQNELVKQADIDGLMGECPFT